MSDLSNSPSQSGALQEDDSLLGQIADEFLERLNRGEEPRMEEYVERYPQLASVIGKVLPALQAIRYDPSEAAVLRDVSSSERPMSGTLGDFRISHEIGRGGMGIVYEAEQISLSRRVALKVLPFAAAMDPKQLQRFKNEAQAAAHLQHTNIVPVHFVGCERGVHFYAMQYIDGQTLAAVIRELQENAQGPMTNDQRMTKHQCPSTDAPVPEADAQTAIRHSTLDILWSLGIGHSSFFRTVARLGVQAAEALEHAHQLGVFHRDIKPANLLVDGGGRLWVTDFGLAHCRSQPALTMTGDLLGTLRYMSPEQALGKRVAVDARTDVYSLGITLYELLTLEPAYNGRNREEVLRQIAFEEPRLPTRLNKPIPAELETIVLKAMERDPAERYATAQDLADDLGRFLEDKPIQAKRPSLRQRAVKWARRHKAVVRAVGVVLVLAVIALLVASALIWQANQELRRERETARRLLYSSDLIAAQKAWEDGHLARARELLDRQRPREDEEDLRGFEWRYLWRLCRDGSLHTFSDHTGPIWAVRFTPDGTMLASASQDGTVRLWDAATRRPILSLEGFEGGAGSLAFTQDGAILAIGSYTGQIQLWDLATRRQVASWQDAAREKRIAFTPDGKLLASGGTSSDSIKLWDIPTGRKRASLPGPGPWNPVAISPDGQTLAAATKDNTVRLWDLATRQETAVLRGHTAQVNELAFSPNGKLLASTSHDATIRPWDLATQREVTTLRGQTSSYAMAFSPDGRTLITTGADSLIRLWDTATWQPVRTLRGHMSQTGAVAVSPNGRTLASGSQDRTVKLWDLAAKPDPEVLPGHEGWTGSVALSPDRKMLASTGAFDHLVKLWDVAAGRQLATLPGHQERVGSVQFTADGKTLVSGCDNMVRFWDVASGRQVAEFKHTDAVKGVALSPDGSMLAAGSSGGSVILWEIATGREMVHWKGKMPVFDPEGKTLAAGLPDGTAGLFDIRTGHVVAPLAGKWPSETQEDFRGDGRRLPYWPVVAFSPDGRYLALSAQRTINLFDFATRQLIACFSEHTNHIWSVAFAPDSKTLASCSSDGTVKLWNLDVLQEAVTLRGHEGQVATVAFAPDGNLLATAGSDGKIRLWRASPWEETDR